MSEQKSFELLQNYSKELIELNKKIIEKSQNYCGFVKFVFNNKEYDIPKIPFLIWSIDLRLIENDPPKNYTEAFSNISIENETNIN